MVTVGATQRVSVLLPARNAAATLPACLRSIERQTEMNFECIIVDDASSDATPSIAAELASRDARFRLVTAGGDGLVAALTRGVEHCHSPLIARMDADDLMHRTRLERQCAELDRCPQLAGVGAHVRLFPRASLSDGRRNYESWLNGRTSTQDIRRDAFVECPLAHPTWNFRREVFERFPYRDCGWPEDYDLLLRALAAGFEFAAVPSRLISWRDSEQRLSRTHAAYTQKAFVACKAEHLAATFLAGRENYVLWGYGSTGRVLRAALAERGLTPSHIVELHPRRIGQKIHGAAVVAPDALTELRRATEEAPGPSLRIVASVSGPKPRGEIRAALSAMHFKEGRDFICAA
jgi:glycosyltransferase involved in cell wall biosynthesis